MWCVLRALNPKERNPKRVNTELRGKENTLNIEGIENPVILKDIAVTVLGWYEDKTIYPLRNSAFTDRDYKIILLLIEKNKVKHYWLIEHLSRLLSSQISNQNGEHNFCLRCLNPFWSHESLNKHQDYCREHEAVKIELPKKGTILKFKNYHRSEKVLFIVYADCESYIKPIQSCDPNPKSSYTKQYQKHEPSSFCYYIKCFDDEVYEQNFVCYTGENAAQKFVEMLEVDIRKINSIPEKKMLFGKKESKRFNEATKMLDLQ